MVHSIPDGFSPWLQHAAREIGAHSAACVRMDHPELRRCIEQNNVRAAAWLKAGLQGEMDYLARMYPQKADPWKTFPFAKSVIVLTFTNHWGDPAATHPFPRPADDALLGYVSAYAKETDYHATGQRMLAELHAMLGEGMRAEATVDTKAVEERLFATVGGLGIFGGNGLLRIPGRTNVRVFIGCLFVEAELPEVIRPPKMPFACDDCLACIKNCPTGAIKFKQPMDARKCISYLTIEKRSLLNREERAMIGDWLFGCDDCTTVCPPKDKVDTRIPVDLEWLLKTPAGELRRLFKGNAVSYAGVTQLRKNAVVVLAKSTSPRAAALLDWVQKNTGSKLVQDQLTACRGGDDVRF
ncbi:epoxyqueuosine reductase [Pontiella sp.]|uniref:epoxyqueuosine reductase n=1 Tax=Pontiella sp. TaxID=2837462 RepID=UPI0035694C09